MIVMIDSNVIIADPHCKGVAWRALIHAAPAWGLRIATTEVVIAEELGGYERLVDARQRELAKLSRSLNQFGLAQVLDRPSAIMAAAKEAYQATLDKILEDCGVEVISVPDIPHMEIVERATKRRRPCDDNGNGYRDTLNWLIVLRTAQSSPTEEVAWVTDDTDFTATDGSGFHADLVGDLMGINASDRVSWCRNLKDLVLKLAAEKSITTGDDLRAVADQLQKKSITDYLTAEIIPAALNAPLDPYRCGLPIEAKGARLLGVTNVHDVDVDLTGSISGDQVIAQFALEATASIDILDSSGKPESEASSELAASEEETTNISKILFFRGIITLDSHGKPITAELSTIEASDDDPGRRKWDEVLAVSSQLADYGKALSGFVLPPIDFKDIVPPLPPGYFNNIVLPSLPPNFFKNIIVPSLPPDYFKNIIVPSLPPAYFNNIVLPSLPPDFFKNLTLPSLPVNYFKTIAMPSLPPDFFKNLMLPSLPADYFKNLTAASEYAESISAESADDEDSDSAGTADDSDEDDDAEGGATEVDEDSTL